MKLSAEIEVIEKYESHVRAAFDDFLDTLPSRIANVRVVAKTQESPNGEPEVRAGRQPRKAPERAEGK